MNDEILKTAREKVEDSLKFLASCSEEKLFFQYLYLVKEIISMYNEYVQALGEEDFEEALKIATQIVTKIDLEKSKGFLKKINLEELSPQGV